MRKLHITVLFAILFLLLPVATAEARPTRALMNVTMNWTIMADGVLDTAVIDVSIPSNSANQRIISQNFSDPYVIIADSDGSKAKFNFSGVRSKLVKASFVIETNYIERHDVAKAAPGDAYLKNSTTVIITPEIKKLADAYKRLGFPFDVVGVMNWTFRNVKYNLSFTDITVDDIVGVTMPSDWVFVNRVGVCDEFSTLFAAFARAQGYPTKVITGFAFTDGRWIPHAWAEVYVPKYGWIEVDPTHNQFLNLNAMRVRIGNGKDMAEMADRINATSREAKSVSLEVTTDVQVLNSTEEDVLTVDAYFLPQPPMEQTQPVVVKAKNKAAGPVFTNAMFVPPMTVDCDQCDAPLFLEPNETKNVDLTLTLPQLVPNTKYSFPSTIMTDYGRKNVSFDRIQIEQSVAEKYSSIEDLPDNFKLFLGLFMIGAVALVVIAILLKW